LRPTYHRDCGHPRSTYSSSIVFPRSRSHRCLHSFPTRRSSDLVVQLHRHSPGRYLGGPILGPILGLGPQGKRRASHRVVERSHQDRKSTRLNSSHGSISYAVFCLKKKNESDMNTCHKLRISATG